MKIVLWVDVDYPKNFLVHDIPIYSHSILYVKLKWTLRSKGIINIFKYYFCFVIGYWVIAHFAAICFPIFMMFF